MQVNTSPEQLSSMLLSLLLAALITTQIQPALSASTQAKGEAEEANPVIKKAHFAGGCFWCVESDFDKLDGVVNVVSGYTGGSAETATYKQVSYEETGHYEAVEVSYDPTIVSYAELVEYFWRHVDPTDPDGQFCDKGSSYRTAIFYSSEEQHKIISASLENLIQNKPFSEPIVTEVIAATPFYHAEPRHQNYYQRNPIRYKFYRTSCGRDKRLAQLWGE